MDGYKHYVRTDANGVVIHGFSDAFLKPVGGEEIIPGDICIDDNASRQFSIQLTNELGQYRYKVVNGVMAERTEVEMFNLDVYKADKIAELNSACNADILSGFTSSALGTLHTYDFDYEAQTNLGGLLNAITAGIITSDQSITYKTLENGPMPHTIAQFKQLYADGLQHKNSKITIYWTKKSVVLGAATKADVDAIVW